VAQAKEYELHDTMRQYRIGCYRNQSNMLGAFFEQIRNGMDPEHLDFLLQRKDDRPIHLASGRDEEVRDWIVDLERTEVDLRLLCGTDVMGLDSYITYALQYPPEVVDKGGGAFNLARYEATVTDGENEWKGRGGTETEAMMRAFINHNEEVRNGKGHS
jgi:hypothetical protein